MPVDGVDLTRIRLKVIDENNLAIFATSDEDFIYRDLIIFNGKDFYHTNKGTSSLIFLDAGKIGDTFMILTDREYDGQLANVTNYALQHDYNKKFYSTGYAETEIQDLGEISPKQIILKHDPLPANSSLKLYFRKDKDSSWGTVLDTFTTLDSVKNIYSFPKGFGAVDFSQFKCELLTSDNISTPFAVSLEFLYLPIGLANSK